MIITLRLRPGKDDGLERWYKSLPDGERSRIIRGILKKYAGQALTMADKTENAYNKSPQKLNEGGVNISGLVSDIFN